MNQTKSSYIFHHPQLIHQLPGHTSKTQHHSHLHTTYPHPSNHKHTYNYSLTTPTEKLNILTNQLKLINILTKKSSPNHRTNYKTPYFSLISNLQTIIQITRKNISFFKIPDNLKNFKPSSTKITIQITHLSQLYIFSNN